MADETVAIATIEVECYLLSEHEGGRKMPIRSDYRPNHQIDGYSTAFIAEVPFPEDRWYYPGERTKATVTALFPKAMKSLLTPGQQWQVNEGPDLVGTAEIVTIEFQH